jgi:hypothetical protein
VSPRRLCGLAAALVVLGSAALAGAYSARQAHGGVAEAARSAAGCRGVGGRLVGLNVTGGRTVGDMTGSITGKYEFAFGGTIASDPSDSARVFGAGTSTVATADGTLTLRETSSSDSADQTGDINTAVLATVIAGTGAWVGTTGHLVYSGFFHTATLSGEFSYTGTVCTQVALVAGEGDARARGAAGGCESVSGHLAVKVTGGTTVGEMTGSVAGGYEFSVDGAVASDPTDSARVFGAGTSTVTTDDGTLTLRETSASDTSDQSSDVNTAVLATVTAGTGGQASVVGHLVYAGYFHSATLSGEFSYTGSLCSPVPPPRGTPPAPPRKPPPKASSVYGGGVTASVRPLRQCPPRSLAVSGGPGRTAATVCGFQATFRFGALPAKRATVKATWYYNRRFVGSVPKARAKVVKSFIAFTGPAPRGFYWCDLAVRPAGKAEKAVARAVVRR